MVANKYSKHHWAMGDRGKALLIVSLITLFITLTLLFYGVSQHNKTIDLQIENTEADIRIAVEGVLQQSLDDCKKRLLTFLEVQPEIVRAFAGRERNRLYTLTLPKINVLKEENRYFSDISFYLPDESLFLSMRDPEHWGDNLTAMRGPLEKIRTEHKPVSGFELVSYGGFFRIIAPILLQSENIGAVEFTLDMHQIIDKMKRLLHMPATSYFTLKNWERVKDFDHHSMVKRDQFVINSHGDPLYAKLPPDLVMDSENHTPVEIEGCDYIVHVHEIFYDFNGAALGGLVLLQDITSLIINKKHFWVQAALFTCLLLLLGFVALHLSFNRLLGAMSREILKRKEATEKLERTARQWSTAIDSEEDAVYILDLDRNLLQANRAFFESMAIDSENALGRPIETIVHPDGKAASCPICQAQKDLQNGQFLREADDPDNSSGRPLKISVTIVRDREQRPLSIFMRRHDLSGEREVADRLRKSKEEWERTFHSVSDLITIQDADMRIVRANRAAEDFFQVEAGGLSCLFCYQVFSGQNSRCQDCPLLRASGESGEHPPVIKHEYLQKIFHISSSPLLGEDGTFEYTVHIARDISEQKALEEELFQAHKMEAIGTLAGGIAHDFNNILSAIIGFSEFVRDDLAEESASRADIEQVLLAADRAKGLVQQILSFSRKSEHQLQILEPYYLVQEVVRMLHATLPSTVVIEEQLDKHAGKINADPGHLHQILVNLCTNAFQAMEGEKGMLQIILRGQEIQERDDLAENIAPGLYCVFQVNDTGQGMDEQTLERIFDPFFTTKEVGKGTGMGLAVLHGIVQDYKGYVHVESRIGEGSTFRVYLPAIDDSESDTVPAEGITDLKRIHGNEEILIVDDDPLLVRMNGRILSNLGYNVTAITSSEEALKKVRENPRQFDLLITDQTMPQLTGAELATEVMGIHPQILVIMCTGHSSIVSREDAMAMGIRRYLFKPVRYKDLVHAVREVFEGMDESS